MSESYSRRDYAEDSPDTPQSKSISAVVNRRRYGRVDLPERREANDKPGHESDEAAVSGYCGGSRDSREATDKADELAAKFEGY